MCLKLESTATFAEIYYVVLHEKTEQEQTALTSLRMWTWCCMRIQNRSYKECGNLIKR